MYIAHFRETDGVEQSLIQHLQETAEISRENGLPLKIPTLCYLAGLLHDSGKFSSEFQNYIMAAKRGVAVVRGTVDHSTHGGQIIRSFQASNKFEQMAIEMIANAVFAHHSSNGLLDFISGEKEAGSPVKKRYEKPLANYEEVRSCFFAEVISESILRKMLQEAGQELGKLEKEHGKIKRTDQFYLLKMVYSALLDGDRRNTQLFEKNSPFSKEDRTELFKTLSKRLEDQFARFRSDDQSMINQLRQEMADACLESAKRPTGIYRLSIPTGSGKTLSSMRFALNHVLANHKRRIIYVIPYSSIIEQNAQVFREVLKDKNHEFILEHHSNLVMDDEDGTEESERKQALLQDNWDSPIIVTTMVRFLENVFSGSTRNPRRIHQLLNSVLIFDEIQSLPPKCLSMFNSLILFLKNYGNTTTLLCSATQPTLEKRKIPLQLEADAEIVPDSLSTNPAFERVQIIDKTKDSGWTAEQLANFAENILLEENNLLVVLNTKNAVRKVYQLLIEKGQEVFHLSTSMTPNHRSEILKEIRQMLDERKKIICVTTPLIEAGVDISFSCVIRSISGLDSIAQAAGRCNRNGESEGLQPVYLVNPSKELENIDKMPEIKTRTYVTEEILRDNSFIEEKKNLLHRNLMEKFFDNYYYQVERTGESEFLFNDGSQRLVELMQKNRNRQMFYQRSLNEKVPTFLVSSSSTIAKHFNVIEQNGESVLVEFGEGPDGGKKMVADLLSLEQIIFDKKWYQRAQRNSLNLYQHEFKELVKNNLITLTEAGVYVLHEAAYDEKFGLNMEADSLNAYQF